MVPLNSKCVLHLVNFSETYLYIWFPRIPSVFHIWLTSLKPMVPLNTKSVSHLVNFSETYGPLEYQVCFTSG